MSSEVTVTCEHGERCGGCVHLGVPYREQLALKQQAVGAALAAYPALSDVPIAEVAAADGCIEYRTRAKLVVSSSREIGLYARGTHDVVDIPRCRVLTPGVLAVVDAVRERLRQRPARVTGIDVREVRSVSGSGVLLTLLGDERQRVALEACARDCAQIPSVLSTAVSIQAQGSAQLLGEVPVPITGSGVAQDSLSVDGPFHYVTHGSFVQAHRGQAHAIARRVIAQLQGTLGTLRGARILELYAGSGALGLLLRQAGARPLLVERYEPALSLLARAASEQQLDGIATRAGDAELVLADLVQAGERFDAVIVNPPRRGLSPLVRARIAQLQPRAALYVSCDPETLARDLTDLAQRGLCTAQVQPFDMMPLARDVESVVLLVRSEPAALRVLHEDERCVVIDKPPHLPTIPQSEHALCVLELLRKQLAVDELFAVHRLDLGTSGVCLFAKRAEHVAPLSAALAAGQKHYLALVRGVTHAKGTIKKPLRDGSVTRDALTRYTRQEVVAGHSLVRVRPEQGRTHQVRKHLASIGRPVLGDARFGDAASNRHFEHRHGLDRSFLHLGRVLLTDPQGGQTLTLQAPLPGDLAAVLAHLREGSKAST